MPYGNPKGKKTMYEGGTGRGKAPKVPMPKYGEETAWKSTGAGGGYRGRPMNPDMGMDESAASNYGKQADKTFDKGRGSGTSGGQTWSDVYKELKSGKKKY